MEFEKFFLKFEKEAKKILEEKNLKNLIFTSNFYEAEVFDTLDKKSYYPFLQLQDDKKILDAFCDCVVSEKEGFCKHLYASFLRITKKDKPLHVRYKKSFFYYLFYNVYKQIGKETKKFKKSLNGRFEIKKNNITYLSLDLEKDKIEVFNSLIESNNSLDKDSIKYSAISENEKREDEENKYEISFLSDISKWFFLMSDDEEKYEIKFLGNKNEIFSNIEISFKNILANFFVTRDDIDLLIPTLNGVNSSLKLFNFEGRELNEIIYDKVDSSFLLQYSEGIAANLKKVELKNYFYIENIGFIPKKKNEFFSLNKIGKDKASYFLKKYKDVFFKKLKNEKISKEILNAKYDLNFDSNNNFHIKLYFLKKDDFKKKYSAFFDNFVFIDGDGFFEVKNIPFKKIETIIEKKDVSKFIDENKDFLFNYKNFQTHFGFFKSYLVYELTKDKNLCFSSKLDFESQDDMFIDFEDWVYVKNVGFYSKKEKRASMPIRPGIKVKKEEISSFISSYRDELEQVDNFFTKKNPIKKHGLEIVVSDDNKIIVRPKIVFNGKYKLDDIIFFDNFGYLKNEGFFEILSHFKLPKGYEKEKIVTSSSENYFLNYELSRLNTSIIYLDKRLNKPKKLTLYLRKIVKRKIKNKVHFLLDLFYKSEIGQVDLREVFIESLENKKFLFSNAGLFDLNKSRFNWLHNLSKTALKDKFIKINTLDLIKLCYFEDFLLFPSKDLKQNEKILEEVKNLEIEKTIDVSLLKATLRPYQEIGVKYLYFLYSYNLSGLLCDDMGLGKTHQAMALLASVMINGKYNYLVVCPTSVIYHWEELLKKFLPSMKVLVYHGFYRKIEKFAKYDLLLTSYGILRSDIKILKKMKFEVAIYDEVQIAKNQFSLTNKALKNIKSKMKLGLTGTPIENYIVEIKAIFDVILPSYLPNEKTFKEFFINPIEKENDSFKKDLLKRIIKPFILRRKKSDVLLDLPEKTEEISYVDLSDEQKKMYNEIITRSKDEFFVKDLKDKNKKVSYIHIFSLLSKLKQVCDHPSLILKDTVNYYKHTCGKFELLIELLNESFESDQKVVIFTQYLGMIEIFENYLKKNKISYALIKGNTKKRQDQIKKFREDKNCKVFVASLLAAGVGIDLSAGSVVIHYDRWWNPAKENQATDRVHRIGQSRGVQVFKMVSKNTIEEKIHEIIKRKSYLIEDMIGKDESDQIKTLSRNELIEIFKQIES